MSESFNDGQRPDEGVFDERPRRGRASESLGTAINVRLQQILLDKLDKMCRTAGVTRAEMLRRLLEEAHGK